MDRYEALALELMQALDKQKKGPPHEEVSATMRGEMAVMRILMEENAPMTAGDLSRALSMTTSRIAAVLNSLEKKGMLIRSADESDKRRVLVTLTGEGRAFCEQKKKNALSNITRLLDRLGEEDAAHFVRITKRIHDILPDQPPMADGKDEKASKEELS